jgi:hypothetical protein
MAFPVSFMFYLKFHGILMFLAVALYLLLKKRKAVFAYFTVFYLVMISPLFIRTGGIGISSSGKYLAEAGLTYSGSSAVILLLKNLNYYLTFGL